VKLRKIISGGQTGADQAGLKAAEMLNIETGGWAPLNWMTEDGPNPNLLKKYKLIQCPVPGFQLRTIANVRDSDATIRFAVDFTSTGERLTKKATIDLNKPCFDVDLNHTPHPYEVAIWIKENNIEVLNIAGNRQSKSKEVDIYKSTLSFLHQVFANLLDIYLVESEEHF
jgi:hypothetical protein